MKLLISLIALKKHLYYKNLSTSVLIEFTHEFWEEEDLTFNMYHLTLWYLRCLYDTMEILLSNTNAEKPLIVNALTNITEYANIWWQFYCGILHKINLCFKYID